MARKGALTALIVLGGFAFAGEEIFRLFGITLPAFELAGGMVLLLIGLDMLEAKRSPTQETAGDAEAAAQRGRGHRSVGRSDAGRAGRDYVGDGAGGAGADALADGGDPDLDRGYGGDLLPGARPFEHVVRVLGDTGIRILVRVMGLLLVALAAQYFVNGLADLGVIAKP